MRKYLITLCFAVIFLTGSAQFYGGNGDGFSLLEINDITLNSQSGYCKGGNFDGFSDQMVTSVSNNTPSIYCSGGNADGFSYSASATSSMNTQSVYCSGGNADGFNSAAFSGTQFAPAIFCSGGNADGFSGAHADGITQNTQSIYCSGGSGDGFDQDSFSGPFTSASIVCSGGDADGFAGSFIHATLNSQPDYCSGGNADGFSTGLLSGFSSGSGVWTGLLSSVWTNAGNWKNSVVPDATLSVTIPAGCPNYPALTGALYINNAGGTYNAKRLDITDGAMITNTGNLYVYGVLNISGSYVANNSGSNTQRIYSGGEIIINPTGIARFGNQSSGTALCDLLVNTGGNLEVLGGLVDVDDQLNIMSGGNLTMTGGALFVHKFGSGSAYSSSYPGSFYLASGATGSISGGTVKVAGKASVTSYTSVNLNSSSFSFAGNSTLLFTDGVTINTDNVDLKTVSGCALQDLTIDRPERIVSIISNAVINGNVVIEPASELKINPASSVTINGDLVLEGP
jgi:hypothetical protein